MGLRKVLQPLTLYIDFPEQLLLYEAQGVNDGSRVDDEGDPLTGTVQERCISDVPFQDFHLSLTLELCKGSRKSKRPYRRPKKSTETSGEGLCGSVEAVATPSRCWLPKHRGDILRLAKQKTFSNDCIVHC